ncbi:MAG: thioredoxin fold domain-containing protein [Sulfurospirillaceae bacterium]|nr:thioredoxin fold domain-containing protein [Sulfurospirillaceae bacterium]
MKKILVLSLASLSLFGASDAQLIEHFKANIQVPNITINVLSRQKIDPKDDIEYVVLNITDGTRAQKLDIFTKGDYIFPDVISVKENGSIKEKFERQMVVSSIAQLYKNEDKSNIVVLGNDAKKETLVVFTDPECPFCKQELESIENKLKTYNIKMIFTPVHQKTSLEKSYLIYKQTATLTDTAKKIAVVKKYFNADADQKVTDAEVEKMENLRRKYLSAGLKGVPFVVSEKELLH